MTRRQRGQSLVELSLVLPAFFMLVFGIFDGGALVYSAVTLDHGVQEAARVALLSSTVSEAQVRDAVRSNAHSLAIPDANITISVNGGATPFESRVAGDRVEVIATYPYQSIVASAFGMKLSLTLTARSEVGAE
jgi:Flp pilus assembly protein TadG